MALPLSLEFCNLHVNPQNSSQLLSLPTEVIQAVGSLLDAADTICLTLSCKKATKTIGFMSWAAVSVARPNGHKRRLLTALERDLPQYHYCRYQDQLCKIPRLEPVHSADNRKSKCPARALRADKELLESAPRLPSYCDIELMWTRHVKGPPWGIPLDSAASSTAWRLRKLTHPHHGDRFFYFTKQDLVCAIADGRLYSRHTSRVWMSLREYHWLLRCENPSSLHDWIVTAPCPHVRNFRARSMLVQVAVGLTKTLTTTEENRWRATVVKTCSRCTTQHRMKAFNHGQCGVEIVQVFWNYLGDGSRESFELYNAQTRLGCSLPQKSLQHIKQLRPEHFRAWQGADKIESGVDSVSLSRASEIWKREIGDAPGPTRLEDSATTGPLKLLSGSTMGKSGWLSRSAPSTQEGGKLKDVSTPATGLPVRRRRLSILRWSSLWWRRASRASY